MDLEKWKYSITQVVNIITTAHETERRTSIFHAVLGVAFYSAMHLVQNSILLYAIMFVYVCQSVCNLEVPWSRRLR